MMVENNVINSGTIFWNHKNLRALQEKYFSNDREWLRQWRENHLDAFLQCGFPNRRDEDWKYTNVSSIAERDFSINSNAEPVNTIDITDYYLEDTFCMVFVDGYYRKDLSRIENLLESVICINVMGVDENHLKKYQILLDKIKKHPSAFSMLNAALFTDGVFILVSANTRVEKPIHILNLTTEHFTANNTSPLMNHLRHTISVQENAEVTIFEEYRAIVANQYFNNIVTYITAETGAKINHYKLQRESENAYHIASTFIEQQGSSQVKNFQVATGAHLNREDLHFSLLSPGAECELQGFYHSQGTQHIDNYSCIDHFVSQCKSQQNYQGVMDDESRAVFNGKVIVHPNAQQTVARQNNKNILLAKTAEINTKPELQIYSDDVQCSHGATVGQLDEEALFYLRARGIDENVAKHLLTCAFAHEVLDAFPASPIVDHIKDHVIKRLSIQAKNPGDNSHE